MNTQQRIENLHKEIDKLKRAMADTDVPFTIEAITEEIDEREQELLQLLEEPTEEEYLEHQQQEYDTRTDLENSQR